MERSPFDGVETLSQMFDLRANYYHPIGTTKEHMPSLDKYALGNSFLLVYQASGGNTTDYSPWLLSTP